MTEDKWTALRLPDEQLSYLETLGGCSQRKARLFGVACCRQAWPVFVNKRSRDVIEMAERFADGLVTRREMDRSVESGQIAIQNHSNHERPAETVACSVGMKKIRPAYVAWLCRLAIQPHKHLDYIQHADGQLRFVLDIFGNPFRPVSFAPEWRTSTAVAIAQGMYDSRDFSAMPILADALQDAGCDHDDILNHCRDASGVHVRGCWVVDHVLGKS